jgi:hypothetical protein
MMAMDTGCRPRELLKLKLKDVVLTQIAETEEWYGEITVNSKTGPRPLALYYSIPFYKEWLEDHPIKGNPNALLFCGLQNNKKICS